MVKPQRLKNRFRLDERARTRRGVTLFEHSDRRGKCPVWYPLHSTLDLFSLGHLCHYFETEAK